MEASSGVWPLYRFDPRRAAAGEPPLHLDIGAPKTSARDYMRNETRFRMVEKSDPRRFARLLEAAERDARRRFSVYQQLAGVSLSGPPEDAPAGRPASVGKE